MSNNSYSSYREGNKPNPKSDPSRKPTKKKSTKQKKAAVQGKKKQQQPKKNTHTRDMQVAKQAPKKRRNSEEQKRLKQEQKAIKKANRSENIKLAKESIFGFLRKTFFVLLIVVLIGETILMLNQNATIDDLKFEINDLNAAYEKENNVLKELNSKKETALKSETIENIARYNLGMVYPSKDQTVYINLD